MQTVTYGSHSAYEKHCTVDDQQKPQRVEIPMHDILPRLELGLKSVGSYFTNSD